MIPNYLYFIVVFMECLHIDFGVIKNQINCREDGSKVLFLSPASDLCAEPYITEISP